MCIYPVCYSSRMSEHGVIGVLCSDQQGLALSGSWSLCQVYNSLINYITPSSLLAILSFSIQHQDNVSLYYLKVISNKSLVNHLTFIFKSLFVIFFLYICNALSLININSLLAYSRSRLFQGGWEIMFFSYQVSKTLVQYKNTQH